MEQFELYKEFSTLDNASLVEYLSSDSFKGSMYMMINTEYVKCDYFDTLCDVEHLLDIRIFNDNCEFRAVRSNMSENFKYRVIDDNDLKSKGSCPEDYYILDESQFLDIASSEGNSYVTIGGGRYTLPIENAEKIMIRNYGVYNSDGELQIKDFRIVNISAKGAK